MSKMSQLHAELTEQAAGLGFKSIEDAEQHGYVIEYKGGRLVPTEELMKQAHEAWLEERDEVLEELRNLHEYFVEDDDLHYSIVVAKAIKLLEEGER